jgi:hypothetical protein
LAQREGVGFVGHAGAVAALPEYLTDDAGDVWAVRGAAGAPVEIDPAVWGWHGPQRDDAREWRRTTEELGALPGFEVTEAPARAFVPGPRPARSLVWETWPDGAAPPAATRSKDGIGGTLAYFDRLSDALGDVARALPLQPDRSPFLVHDFVGGRLIRVVYTPAAPAPGGPGSVYLVTDGDGIKIGYTTLPVAQRIAALQTGNPRTIRTLVTIHGAGLDVEATLHRAFGKHQGIGEWFQWPPLLDLALDAGGWEALLRGLLGGGDWRVDVHRSANG